jgi:pimeloyl-ACP methyl ester carboxylesterase
VPGERRDLDGRAGRLACYVAGDGPPLLLIHSINAAGSAYEVRPIFERAMARRRAWAVDLPGFGNSDRSERRYDLRLCTDAVHDVLDAIAAEGPAPVDALAISLGCEFLARAAIERPGRLRSLTLVTPTGLGKGSQRLRGRPGASREIPLLHRALTARLWSKGLFDLLVSERSMRFFLRKTFGSERIDEGLLAYDRLTAQQPGARHAPLAFVAGRLFSADIRDVYERLTLPVWVPHATRGDFADMSGAGWTRARPSWTLQPYPTGALPHFELPDRFAADLEAFLGDPGRSPPREPALAGPV